MGSVFTLHAQSSGANNNLFFHLDLQSVAASTSTCYSIGHYGHNGTGKKPGKDECLRTIVGAFIVDVKRGHRTERKRGDAFLRLPPLGFEGGEAPLNFFIGIDGH